jgi:non-homologous end joining protein Ku
MKLIKARMKGERPRLTGEEPEPQEGKVVDLMERLRQSLEQQGGRKKVAARKKKSKSRRAA